MAREDTLCLQVVAREVGTLGPLGRGQVALLEAVALPVPWTSLAAFAPEVLVFASRNAVEVFVRSATERDRSVDNTRWHCQWDWRRARLAAVGATTARALSTRLAEQGHLAAEVIVPAEAQVGLAPVLEALADRAKEEGRPPWRIAAFGARGGRAHMVTANDAQGAQGSLLPVDSYVLVPSEDGAEEVARAARTGSVTFEVGSGALAHALVDALEAHGLLSTGNGMQFVPRHASARDALLERLTGRQASIAELPPAR